MQIDLENLPKLKRVFQELLRGYHLSNEDFELYHDIQDHESEYASLLAALGYKLASDQRGFYYLLPENEQDVLNTTTRKMALVIFLLVEYLADKGRDPRSEITQGHHEVPETANALWETYSDLLAEAGFATQDAVEKCLQNNFTSLGFAQIQGNMLRFRPPIQRFLDICMELGRGEDNEPESIDGEDKQGQ